MIKYNYGNFVSVQLNVLKPVHNMCVQKTTFQSAFTNSCNSQDKHSPEKKTKQSLFNPEHCITHRFGFPPSQNTVSTFMLADIVLTLRFCANKIKNIILYVHDSTMYVHDNIL